MEKLFLFDLKMQQLTRKRTAAEGMNLVSSDPHNFPPRFVVSEY